MAKLGVRDGNQSRSLSNETVFGTSVFARRRHQVRHTKQALRIPICLAFFVHTNWQERKESHHERDATAKHSPGDNIWEHRDNAFKRSQRVLPDVPCTHLALRGNLTPLLARSEVAKVCDWISGPGGG